METTYQPDPGDKSTYPFRVGTMVYRTVADAEAAIERSREIYPHHPFQVTDRETGKAVTK